MAIKSKNLPSYISETSLTKDEISITGKWIPSQKGTLFFRSEESKEMRDEWNVIHNEARSTKGVLSTEINHAVGQDAVLVHHVFKNEAALNNYYKNTADTHEKVLKNVAKPDVHLVRGNNISDTTMEIISKKAPQSSFGTYLYGYVKNDHIKPDPAKAIQVTAKWISTTKENFDELIYWWQQVGTDAFELETGLLRFEVFQVNNENALIIHETFETNEDLQFHLTKGTAAKYKKEIDQIAYPENYFFRGPVSWMIRTYSKFMHLPATYSRSIKQFTSPEGSMSDGLNSNNNQNRTDMKTQEITVVYQWIANEGKSEELQRIYNNVERDMQETEPGALKVQCFFDDSNRTLIVEDVFADASALGQHLGTTAANHFPSLLEIATPGPFLFCGEVPAEMQQAALNMGLDAKFALHTNGFERVPVNS